MNGRAEGFMMRTWACCVGLAVAWVLGPTGCSRKPDATSAVSELERVLAAAPQSVPLQVAVAAARTNDAASGVIALQEARRQPGLTADQLQVVEQAAQLIVADLVRRAADGDARAKAQLEAIERSRSQ